MAISHFVEGQERLPCLIELHPSPVDHFTRGKIASCLVGADELIEHNAAPFNLIRGKQKPGANRERITRATRPRYLLSEVVPMLHGHWQFRLAEKIADQFGGIVPTGVFEIEEAKLAVIGQQGIVKPEVRWGKASRIGGERLVHCQTQLAGQPLGSVPHSRPRRRKFLPEERHRASVDLRHNLYLLQSRNATRNASQMTIYAEASLGGLRHASRPGGLLQAVQLGDKVCRLPH